MILQVTAKRENVWDRVLVRATTPRSRSNRTRHERAFADGAQVDKIDRVVENVTHGMGGGNGHRGFLPIPPVPTMLTKRRDSNRRKPSPVRRRGPPCASAVTAAASQCSEPARIGQASRAQGACFSFARHFRHEAITPASDVLNISRAVFSFSKDLPQRCDSDSETPFSDDIRPSSRQEFALTDEFTSHFGESKKHIKSAASYLDLFLVLEQQPLRWEQPVRTKAVSALYSHGIRTDNPVKVFSNKDL